MKGMGLLLVLIIVVAIVFAVNYAITGKVIGNAPPESVGPSQEEQSCMRGCMSQFCPDLQNAGCTSKYSSQCLSQCNMEGQPAPASEEESCMQVCVVKGCSVNDFACQNNNKGICEEECGMIKEPEAKSEEEKCIRDCVNEIEPGLICQAGEGGEKGNEVCQQCAKQCEHLYAGPCLTELILEARKAECNTCENCYAKPIMGDSGEGYECIVDIECGDSTEEFGDAPGNGEGIISKAGDTIGNVIESIGDFFKGIFGIGDGGQEAEE